MHQSSTSTYIPNFIEIEKTFCGRTDGRIRTGERTFETGLLGRLRGVDLINNNSMLTVRPTTSLSLSLSTTTWTLIQPGAMLINNSIKDMQSGLDHRAAEFLGFSFLVFHYFSFLCSALDQAGHASLQLLSAR